MDLVGTKGTGDAQWLWQGQGEAMGATVARAAGRGWQGGLAQEQRGSCRPTGWDAGWGGSSVTLISVDLRTESEWLRSSYPLDISKMKNLIKYT